MGKDQKVKTDAPTLSKQQKFVCAAIGSEADLLFVHPLETIAKQQQIAKEPLIKSLKNSTLNIYKELLNPGFFHKLSGFYKGVYWSGFNKFSSRSLRYLGQDSLQIKLQDRFMPLMGSVFNETQNKAIFGAISGFTVSSFETVTLYPLDVIKTRIQLNAVSTEIYHHLYKGLLLTLLRNSFSSAIFFGSYNYFSNKDKDKLRNDLLAPIEASLVTTGLNNPIEVIKVRMQSPTALNKPMGMFEAVKTALAKEGAMVFAKGLPARFIQAPIKTAWPFLTFNFLKRKFEEQNAKRELNQHSLKPPSRLP